MMVQSRSTGLILDDNAYDNTNQLATGLNVGPVDSVASFKKYYLKAGVQGKISSCVGWATGYSALSISLALQHELSNNLASQLARSNMFIYN